MKQHKYKMLISYDGSNYFGWQIQKNQITIQKAIQDALFLIFRKKINISASGRTDAKVHANGQVAHFLIDEQIDTKKTIYVLNRILNNDIKILDLNEVDLSFHARFSAISKIYHYHLCLKDIQDPFSRFYSYKPYKKIDIDLLKKGAEKFIGKKDFTSFSNKPNRGSCKNNPIKNLTRLDVIETENGITLEFEADGFLYKMVRNITSTLLDVATKKIPLNKIDEIFISKDRQAINASAPPQALFLEKVIY